MWTPTYSVINSRAIAENLLTYFEANQVEALLWAHGTALKPIARFENSRANVNEPVYPAILFSDDNDATDYTGSYPRSGYSVTYEVLITGSSPTTVVLNARSYARGIESMIRNIPNASLYVNTNATQNGIALLSVEKGFDPIKVNDAGNDFMQQFQVRATYTLEGADI